MLCLKLSCTTFRSLLFFLYNSITGGMVLQSETVGIDAISHKPLILPVRNPVTFKKLTLLLVNSRDKIRVFFQTAPNIFIYDKPILFKFVKMIKLRTMKYLSCDSRIQENICFIYF